MFSEDFKPPRKKEKEKGKNRLGLRNVRKHNGPPRDSSFIFADVIRSPRQISSGQGENHLRRKAEHGQNGRWERTASFSNKNPRIVARGEEERKRFACQVRAASPTSGKSIASLSSPRVCSKPVPRTDRLASRSVA